MNMPITAGTQLKTENGQAEVEFENGSTVRLTPETRVSFDGLSLREDGAKVSLLTLEQGVAYFNLNHKDNNNFKVQFAGRDFEAKKSAHFRADVARDSARLAVFNGQVDIAVPGKRVSVHKNETFSFDPEDEARYTLAKGIDEYQFDTWDVQRDQYQSQYARVNYASGAPYYGWDDLNYYGSFAYIPGYGNLWRPYGVGYGWAPFSVGYWMWYPAFGYTWVSPYAWGWTPYRYGGWQFISGYGWGWRPGPWRSWNTVAPVYGAPPYYRVPRPPLGFVGRGVVAVGNPRPAAPSPLFNPMLVPHGNFVRQQMRVLPLPTPNVTTNAVPVRAPAGTHMMPSAPPPRSNIVVGNVGRGTFNGGSMARPMSGGSMAGRPMGGGSMAGRSMGPLDARCRL